MNPSANNSRHPGVDGFAIDLPDFPETPLRRREAVRDWGRMMDAFDPFAREHWRRHAEDPETMRMRYRITESERFSL